MNTWKTIATASLGLTLTAGLASAAEVTFYKDVLPVLQENCQVCHRPSGANLGGMVAPMAFESYKETRPWAKAMAKAVANKTMPPWHAAPQHQGEFMNERTISQENMDIITAWANTGAKRGNPKDAPASREWPGKDGWTIGTPDLILKTDQVFFVEDDVEDLYVDLTTQLTDDMISEDKFIKAVEFRPGSSAVHHIIAMPLGGIAPGNEASVYPDGIASVLKKGSEITWQMHYHKEPGPGTGMYDQSMVAIKFYDNPEDVKFRMSGAHLGRFDFNIPAGESSYTIQQEYTFPNDSEIVSLMPHFHLRGKSAKYEAFYPDGSSEVLLDVPQYDFNWQTAYKYNDFKKAPAGTKIIFTSVFDNSEGNVFNPDATVDIGWGRPTTDEMSFGYMSFVDSTGKYQPMMGGAGAGNGGLSLVQIVNMFDKNEDGLLQKDEAPGRLTRYFDMIDTNKDGAIDAKEAAVANKFTKNRRRGNQRNSSDD
ncbi:MAG: hypothetical protein COA73_12425 [Candidatus Hydrogenedentota bacterium]|nr:MAG: hypothetical protein COA73_12425 [Candidatus Hydrogenedentota bacterium]